jgi:hypothetical protein
MQQQQQALQLAELNRQSEERTRQGVALPLLSSVAGRSSPSDSDALTPRRTKSAKDRELNRGMNRRAPPCCAIGLPAVCCQHNLLSVCFLALFDHGSQFHARHPSITVAQQRFECAPVQQPGIFFAFQERLHILHGPVPVNRTHFFQHHGTPVVGRNDRPAPSCLFQCIVQKRGSEKRNRRQVPPWNAQFENAPASCTR